VVRAGQKEADHVALAIGREPPEPNGPLVAKYLFGYLADAHYVWGMLGSCTLMARRRTFLTIGDFDAGFRRSAELDFAVRAAFQGAHFIAVNQPLITQYKTASADKSGSIPVEYALKLRRKHRDYLSRENVYWASIVMAHAWFHGNAGRSWRHHLLLALAYGLLPPSILIGKLRWRFLRHSSQESSQMSRFSKAARNMQI
jgi:GT2 family glycosyltransferase